MASKAAVCKVCGRNYNQGNKAIATTHCVHCHEFPPLDTHQTLDLNGNIQQDENPRFCGSMSPNQGKPLELLRVAHGTLRCELCAYFAKLVCHPSKKALPETAPRQIWNDLTDRGEKTKKKNCVPRHTSGWVRVPGVPGDCAWVPGLDQSLGVKGAELARKLQIGHKVKPSSQWKSGNKGGPPGASGIVPGASGIVVYIGSAQSVLQGMVQVFWNSGQKREWHSMGRDNIYELDLA